MPVPTFFAAEDESNYYDINPSLDLATQSKHSLFLVQGGIRGLVLLGSTGEAIHVADAERSELIRSQRKTLDDAGYKDRVIIAGTTAQNIPEVIQQVKESAEAGAQFAMVLSPGYFAAAANQTGIEKWFEAVADQAAIPILM